MNLGDVDLEATGDCADLQAMERNALQTKMFKLRKRMNADLVKELDAMSEEDMRKKIVEAEGVIHESEQAKDADEELADLKEQVKNAIAPYNELKKTQTNIVKYLTCRMDENGRL